VKCKEKIGVARCVKCQPVYSQSAKEPGSSHLNVLPVEVILTNICIRHLHKPIHHEEYGRNDWRKSLCCIDRLVTGSIRELFRIHNNNNNKEVAKSLHGNLNGEDVSSCPTTSSYSTQTEVGKLPNLLVPSIQFTFGLRNYNAFADDESTDLWADNCDYIYIYILQNNLFTLLMKAGSCSLECCSHLNSL
jgi:hypothetical protein